MNGCKNAFKAYTNSKLSHLLTNNKTSIHQSTLANNFIKTHFRQFGGRQGGLSSTNYMSYIQQKQKANLDKSQENRESNSVKEMESENHNME